MGDLSLAIERLCAEELGQNTSFRGLTMITENPYRILGLSSIANSVDAKSTAELIATVTTEGKSYKTPFDLDILGKIDRSAKNCQNAVMRLKFKEVDLKILWFKSKKSVLGFGSPESLNRFFTPFFNTYTLNYDDFLASYIFLLLKDPDFTQIDLYRHLLSVINNMLILTPEDFGAVFKNESPVELDVDDELLLVSFATVILRPFYDIVSELDLNNPKDVATLENLFGVFAKVNTPCMAFYRFNDYAYTLLSQWFAKQADEINYKVLTLVRDGNIVDAQERQVIADSYQQLRNQVLPTFVKIVDNFIPGTNEINLQMRMQFFVKFKGFPALLEKAGDFDAALEFTEILKDYAPSNDVYEQLEDEDQRLRAGLAAERRKQEAQPEYIISTADEEVFWGEAPETPTTAQPEEPAAFEGSPSENPYQEQNQEQYQYQEQPADNNGYYQNGYDYNNGYYDNNAYNSHYNYDGYDDNVSADNAYEDYGYDNNNYNTYADDLQEENQFAESYAAPIPSQEVDSDLSQDLTEMDKAFMENLDKIKVKEIVSSRVVSTAAPKEKGLGLTKFIFGTVLICALCFGFWQISKVVNQPTVEVLASKKIEILQSKDTIISNTDKLAELKNQIYYNKALYETTGDRFYAEEYNRLVGEYNDFYTVYEKSAVNYNNQVEDYNKKLKT